jgi:hypothetical protein
MADDEDRRRSEATIARWERIAAGVENSFGHLNYSPEAWEPSQREFRWNDGRDFADIHDYARQAWEGVLQLSQATRRDDGTSVLDHVGEGLSTLLVALSLLEWHGERFRDVVLRARVGLGEDGGRVNEVEWVARDLPALRGDDRSRSRAATLVLALQQQSRVTLEMLGSPSGIARLDETDIELFRSHIGRVEETARSLREMLDVERAR